MNFSPASRPPGPLPFAAASPSPLAHSIPPPPPGGCLAPRSHFPHACTLCSFRPPVLSPFLYIVLPWSPLYSSDVTVGSHRVVSCLDRSQSPSRSVMSTSGGYVPSDVRPRGKWQLLLTVLRGPLASWRALHSSSSRHAPRPPSDHVAPDRVEGPYHHDYHGRPPMPKMGGLARMLRGTCNSCGKYLSSFKPELVVPG
jgi:hypothetical protein